jgi:hypothetical protein
MSSYKPPLMLREPIQPDRVRAIDGSFAFVPHTFLRRGFFAALTASERDLYFFLLLAADRRGVSFYHYDSICAALECSLDDYLAARNGLIDKDLIAFDGTRFQVLSLPDKLRSRTSSSLRHGDDMEAHDPATIRRLIDGSR